MNVCVRVCVYVCVCLCLCVCVCVCVRARLTKLVYSACDRAEQNNRLKEV